MAMMATFRYTETCPRCQGRKDHRSQRCRQCERGRSRGNNRALADQYRVSVRVIRMLGGAERLNRLEECFRAVLIRSMNPGHSKDLIRGGLKRRGWKACNVRTEKGGAG